MSLFQQATKAKSRLRLVLVGPAKAGKSFTALRFAHALAAKIEQVQGRPARIAVLSTEHGAIEKYLGEQPDGIPFNFLAGRPANFAPPSYVAAIRDAVRSGVDVLIIDSLSHAWIGKDGALDQVDKKKQDPKKNSFTAWADITPQHRELIEEINQCPIHVIATLRASMEYVMEEEVTASGARKSRVTAIGMQPEQRKGVEYEFDILCNLERDHTMRVDGSRCPAVDGAVVVKPGAAFIEPIWEWLQDGVDVPQPAPGSAVAPPPPTTAEAGRLSVAVRRRAAWRFYRAARDRVDQDGVPTVDPLFITMAVSPSANGSGHTPGPGERDPRNGPPAERPASPVAAQADPASEITKEQLVEINRLCEALGVPPKVRDATWLRYRVGSWRSLTFGQANEIIDKLRAFELGEQTPPWEARGAATENGTASSAPSGGELQKVPFEAAAT